MKGQKIRQWKRGKDVHRESGAQRISGFGDFQTGQDKTLVPEEAKACSTKIWGCDPAFCLVLCFHNTDFYHHTYSVIKVFAKLHIPQYFISLLVSMRFSRVSPHSSASQSPVLRSCHQCPPETCWIACALLHGLSSRYHGGLSPPWGLGLVNMRLLPVVWIKSHLLFFSSSCECNVFCEN